MYIHISVYVFVFVCVPLDFVLPAPAARWPRVCRLRWSRRSGTCGRGARIQPAGDLECQSESPDYMSSTSHLEHGGCPHIWIMMTKVNPVDQGWANTFKSPALVTESKPQMRLFKDNRCLNMLNLSNEVVLSHQAFVWRWSPLNW